MTGERPDSPRPRDLVRAQIDHVDGTTVPYQFSCEQTWRIRGPLATTFHLAGQRLVEDLMRRERGEGWWGARRPDPTERTFDIVQVWSAVHPDSTPPAGGDHAGINETSYVLAACPGAVDMSRLGPGAPWYTVEPTGPASGGTAARGEVMFEAMAAAWAAELGPVR